MLRRKLIRSNESRRKRAIESLKDANAARRGPQGTDPHRQRKTAGANGRLFGAVTSADITEAATAASGKPVDRRSINIATAIESVGTYKATAKLHADVSANLTVEVVAE